METTLTPDERKRQTANKNLEKARVEKKRLQEQARLAMEAQKNRVKQPPVPPFEENMIYTDDEDYTEEEEPKQPKRKEPKHLNITPYESKKRKTPAPVQTKSPKKPKTVEDLEDDSMDIESNESFFFRWHC